MAKKKSKSPNLVLPILLVSTVVSILYLTYLNWPKASPISINEVGSTSTTNCSQLAFSDSFTEAIDTNRWLVSPSDGGDISTMNGQLIFTLPGMKESAFASLFTKDKVEIVGDFTTEITLKSLTTTPTTSTNASFFLGIASDDDKNTYRLEIYKDGNIVTYSATNKEFPGTQPTNVVNVYRGGITKLKITRSGSSLVTAYDIGSGYVIHSSIDGVYTNKVFVHFGALSHQSDLPKVVATADDFSISCPTPPKPTNLKSSCNGRGDKVVLTWDHTSPGKYAFALDDTTNNENDKWLISGSTDVWRGGDYTDNKYDLPVIPGHTYKWWVISNIAGPGSLSSAPTVATFTCKESLPPAPTNLRATCAPDGKSARLTWDGVVDAESYKVRFDDKAGHVTYYDNLKQPQHIVTTVPGKSYSFWAHSHKGDVDSNQSTAVDFTCQATSTPTPTPKPSVKASPIPTSTPEISVTNIATPTPQATTTITNTYVMSPRATQNTAINTEPTTTESTPTSTNPLYRFFSWIAGLFK